MLRAKNSDYFFVVVVFFLGSSGVTGPVRIF
jgi:hypothetical protein